MNFSPSFFRVSWRLGEGTELKRTKELARIVFIGSVAFLQMQASNFSYFPCKISKLLCSVTQGYTSSRFIGSYFSQEVITQMELNSHVVFGKRRGRVGIIKFISVLNKHITGQVCFSIQLMHMPSKSPNRGLMYSHSSIHGKNEPVCMVGMNTIGES